MEDKFKPDFSFIFCCILEKTMLKIRLPKASPRESKNPISRIVNPLSLR